MSWTSPDVLGAQRSFTDVSVPSVLSSGQFSFSIDGPCWIGGVLMNPVVARSELVKLYGAVTASDYDKHFVSNVALKLLSMQSMVYPIGFATDGVTIEAYGGFDVANIGSGDTGMDTPSYGPILGRFGRIAVHANMNIISKMASSFFKAVFGGRFVNSSYVVGNQLLGFTELPSNAFFNTLKGLVFANSATSMYHIHNLVSARGWSIPALLVKQVMTSRGYGMASSVGLANRLMPSVFDADLFLVNTYPADPYIAFVGQQPSFIEAKFLCFGFSVEPTPVAIGKIDGVNSCYSGVPNDLPNKSDNTIMVYAPRRGLFGIEFVVKAHCGNSPNATRVEYNNIYHFFGWSSYRLGSML